MMESKQSRVSKVFKVSNSQGFQEFIKGSQEFVIKVVKVFKIVLSGKTHKQSKFRFTQPSMVCFP